MIILTPTAESLDSVCEHVDRRVFDGEIQLYSQVLYHLVETEN